MHSTADRPCTGEAELQLRLSFLCVTGWPAVNACIHQQVGQAQEEAEMQLHLSFPHVVGWPAVYACIHPTPDRPCSGEAELQLRLSFPCVTGWSAVHAHIQEQVGHAQEKLSCSCTSAFPV
jgi:hypothetical protein